jgi:hypothetical protein
MNPAKKLTLGLLDTPKLPCAPSKRAVDPAGNRAIATVCLIVIPPVFGIVMVYTPGAGFTTYQSSAETSGEVAAFTGNAVAELSVYGPNVGAPPARSVALSHFNGRTITASPGFTV